jgi:tudor domain-containing protein 1/4/6/7
VPKTNLKVLDPRFKTSALMWRVVVPYILLDGVSETEVINDLTHQTADYLMTLTLIEQYRGAWWIGNISYNGVGVDQVLSESKKIKTVDIQETKAQIDSLEDGRHENSEAIAAVAERHNTSQAQSSSTFESSFDMDKLQIGVVCHVDDPENFYICLKQDVEAVEELTTNLQIVAPSLPALGKYEVGSLCIAKYTVHDKWYRAKIIGYEPDMITLYYIDHGFIDCLLDLSLAESMLKVYHEISPRNEGFAINCALIVKPVHREWPDEACAVLREFLHKEVYFDVISILCEAPPQKHLIKCFISNNVSLADRLLVQNFAAAYRPIKSLGECYVSHINSLSEFYIQMEDDSDNLEVLASYTMDAENDEAEFPVLQTIEQNTLCIARFPDDDLWYRAKILSQNEDETVDVLFLDYGNTCTNLPTSMLRYLKPDFDEVLPFAMKCSLQTPDNVLHWSEAAELKFRELADEGSTTFKVQLIKTSECNSPNLISLWLNETNIADQLQDLCEQYVPTLERAMKSFENNALNANMCAFTGAVITTVYHTPINFYLQHQASADLLSEISEYYKHLSLSTAKFK